MIGRKEINLNQSWKFKLDDIPMAAYKGFDDSEWRTVDLPHDWSVEFPFSQEHSSGTGYLPAGMGYYRKAFSLPGEYAGKRVFVVFDGIYNNAMVWFNSYYLGKRPSGYSPQIYELTDFAKFGESNVLTVKADHRNIADSRWFTGSGIYRSVKLIVKDRISIDNYGVFVSTDYADNEKARLSINIKTTNAASYDSVITVRASLYEHDSNSQNTNAICLKSLSKKEISVKADSNENINLTMDITGQKLWSPDNPNLYNLITEVISDAQPSILLDSVETRIGIRTFKFDPDLGFSINGTSMKLKGVCVHHDAGCLGAAVRPEVWRRRLEILKDMGTNAIRMSHNPHMTELYDLCDELGFLVIDEAFDEWEGVKNKWARGHNVYPPAHYGYYEDFPEWHERDLTAMIERDKNHPCIILWSIGNEIDYPNDPYCHPSFDQMTGNNDANKPAAERIYSPDRPNSERLAVIAAKLAAIVKSLDSTRPVTAALAFPELSNKIGYADCLDVVGYNYMERCYGQDHKDYPNRPIIGSENKKSLDAWIAVEENDYIAGQFLWTGIDFLGETRGWPSHGSSAGLMDLAGFEKPEYYYRKSLWSDKPFVKIFTNPKDNADLYTLNPSWNYQTREKLIVVCFTNLKNTELFLNGESLGIKLRNENRYVEWELEFEEGKLTAHSWDEPGAVYESTIETVGKPHEIRLIKEDSKLSADKPSVIHIIAEILDKRGRLVYSAENMLSVSVAGNGRVIGLENGDLADTMAYNTQQRKAHHGKLLIYMLIEPNPGEITLKVNADGLGEGRMEI